MLKNFWREYKTYIITLSAIAALIAAMWIFSIPCPIKYITGMSCAGCGMSRAMLSVLRLDFSTAFAYHPLWIVIIPAILSIVILSAKGKGKAAGIVFHCLVGLFLAVWIIRLATGDSVVAFEPDGSLVSRAIKGIAELLGNKQ